MKKLLVVFAGIISVMFVMAGGYFVAKFIDGRINKNRDSQQNVEEHQAITTSSEENNVEESASEEINSAKIEADNVYDKLIVDYVKKWREYTDNGKSGNLESLYESNTLAYSSYNIFLMNEGFSDAGYLIEDLDDDGVYELIIASTTSSMVYDLYTLEDGSPKLILASWSRCDVLYCGDYFYRVGSSGASSASMAKFKLINSNPKVSDAVYSWPTDDWSEVIYYHSETSESDPNEGVEITKEEFDRYANILKAGNRVVDGLISFDSYVEEYGH